MDETRDSTHLKSIRPSTTASTGLSQDEQLAQTGAIRLLDKKQKMFELQEALEKEKGELLSKVLLALVTVGSILAFALILVNACFLSGLHCRGGK